jgi:hypothetical protein
VSDQEITFIVRASEGHPQEELPATYSPAERVEMRTLTRRVAAMPPGPERTALLNEMCVIHELKALLDATPLSPAEEADLRRRTPAPWDEPEPEVKQRPKQSEQAAMFESLPTPDDNRLGQFHAPWRGAPVTERRAAILVFPRTGTQRRRVLDFIASCDERGATDYEVAQALGSITHRWVLATRRGELEKDGWVRDSGKTRKTDTGSDAAVWVLTEQGREEWPKLAARK